MAALLASKFPAVTPDARVLVATAPLAVLMGLAMAVVSAWRPVTARVDEGLRSGRRIIGSLGRFGRGLLVAQVALSMALLVGAGLFTATLARLRANDTSLQSQRIVFTRAYRERGDRQPYHLSTTKRSSTAFATGRGPMRPRCRCFTQRTSDTLTASQHENQSAKWPSDTIRQSE